MANPPLQWTSTRALKVYIEPCASCPARGSPLSGSVIRHMNVERLTHGVLYIDLRVTDWADVVPRLGQAWPVVVQGIEDFVRAQPDWVWDRLRAYIRFGSGLIWFSPDPEHPLRNANVAGVKLACLEALYYELPDPEVEPDTFERAHADMDRRIFDALRQSGLLASARASLAALQRVRPHAITVVQYDDLETERILIDEAELSTAG